MRVKVKVRVGVGLGYMLRLGLGLRLGLRWVGARVRDRVIAHLDLGPALLPLSKILPMHPRP
jgi:hypothetical protein